MRVIYNLDEMTETARGWLAGGTVGFVPTMGYLHEGHATLVKAAQEECEISVVSIFVNALQFRSRAEAARHPRDLVRDIQMLTALNVDVVFVPRTEEMYPPDFSSFVTPKGMLAESLESTVYPGYAQGIATVMTKLFQLVRPDIVYFGEKDIQQVAVVRQLIHDLNIDIKLRVLPIVRESDGLVMSGSNQLLTPAERQAASVLYRALLAGKALIEQGEHTSEVVIQAMAQLIQNEPLVKLDYVAICDPQKLAPLSEITSEAALIIAIQVGDMRLIDNLLYKS